MKWVVRKGLLSLFTLFCSITITFFLFRIIPGNPVDIMILEYMRGGDSYEEALTKVSRIIPFLPNKPIHEQYVDFLKGVFTGNLGYSIWLATPVTKILGYAIPWTIFAVSISLIISFLLGIVIGMYTAYKRGSIIDKVLSFYSSVSTATPQNVLGFFIIWILAVQLRLFPSSGPYGPNVDPKVFNLEFLLSVLYHAILPILTYVLTSLGGWILTMKSSTVSVLGENYVTAAEARGLKDRRIALSYVGRNAILPLFTRFAISLGFMFGGVLLIENLFLYPGIGRYLNLAVNYRDYSLISGCFLITSVAVVAANFIADLLYGKLDPRVKFD
jgi:peptide/nickel transport system permease protein